MAEDKRNTGISMFGFEITRKKDKKPDRPSFVTKTDEDGAGVIQAGGHFGAYLDVDGDKAKTDVDMICLLYTSPSPRDKRQSRMPSSA